MLSVPLRQQIHVVELKIKNFSYLSLTCKHHIYTGRRIFGGHSVPIYGTPTTVYWRLSCASGGLTAWYGFIGSSCNVATTRHIFYFSPLKPPVLYLETSFIALKGWKPLNLGKIYPAVKGVCAILLWLYTSTEPLKRAYISARPLLGICYWR